MSRLLNTACVSLALLMTVSACDAPVTPPAQRPAGAAAVTISVPGDARTIQAAVDVAREGDTILISPGTYTESVRVRTARITLRGADRNTVVIDGEFRRGNGVTVSAADVTVENLTVRNHLFNGLLFTGVTDESLHAAGNRDYRHLDTSRFPPLAGFRAAYVTAHNNALYGIYAFDARDGVIERNYTSGHADSGIYVGQCQPCDIRVEANVAEHNAVGMEFTNASQGLVVIGNRITRNRVGVTIASNRLEAYAPQHSLTLVGNAITANAEPVSPAQADGGFGLGVAVGGGQKNTLSRNLITDHPNAAVTVIDTADFPSTGNTISGNRYRGNGRDLVTTGSSSAQHAAAGGGAAIGKPGPKSAPAPPGLSFRDIPAPPAQPQRGNPVPPLDPEAVVAPASADSVPSIPAA